MPIVWEILGSNRQRKPTYGTENWAKSSDIFIEQCISYYNTYNRLVTVFPWKHEYYQGIFFLTLNRDIQFDNTIICWIYLIIKYKDLSKEFRRDFWSTFLAKAHTVQEPTMTEEHDLRKLESLKLNRREINSRAPCPCRLLTGLD